MINLDNSISLTVDNDGIRADVYLTNELSDFTRSRIKRHIELGFIKVNGVVLKKAGTTLKMLDHIEVVIEELKQLKAVPQNLPIDIIYEDADIAVINKPQGMATHPAPGSLDGTLVNALLYHIKDLSSINGVIRPGIVHRLDKNTSGLIVIAKTNLAHQSLSRQIAEKSAQRFYCGLVDGNLRSDEGIINAPIARSKADRKKMAVAKTGEGRSSLTNYKVLERFKDYTFVEYKLSTGRTHQIRVHSKYINHPIVGDSVYGGSNKFGLNGQLLHAKTLILTHPTTNESMEFKATIPDYFDKVLVKLASQSKF
ncbi:MAG: RluA family pseudouridine synthase [Christensenellaceae bacterium]|jgi:23S rRNA pseudouridine1911/1915/1917 synthase|nr:RluA family pseudouridine synthase [Christensenellaceae bacterium]